MDKGVSRGITTNQKGPHDNLEKVVRKHLEHPSLKPFSQHTVDAFRDIQEWIADWQGAIILDSCCGVGESTRYIAQQNPHAKVIGVDKSALRVGKHQHYTVPAGDNGGSHPTNYCLVRADLNDFWRLAHQANWQLEQHFLLYPNPYPKSAHLQRRWHGSSAFADILKLKGKLTVRSNWGIYVEEFCQALNIAGISAHPEHYTAREPMTPFERKYWASGQQSWQLSVTL